MAIVGLKVNRCSRRKLFGDSLFHLIYTLLHVFVAGLDVILLHQIFHCTLHLVASVLAAAGSERESNYGACESATEYSYYIT